MKFTFSILPMLFTILTVQTTFQYQQGQQIDGQILATGNIITKNSGDVIVKMNASCILIYKNNGIKQKSGLKGIVSSQFNLSKQADQICLDDKNADIVKAFVFDVTQQGKNDIVLVSKYQSSADNYSVYLISQSNTDEHVYNLSGALFFAPVKVLYDLPKLPNILFSPNNEGPYFAYITDDGILKYYANSIKNNLVQCIHSGNGCFSSVQEVNISYILNLTYVAFDNIILQGDFGTDCRPQLQVIFSSKDVIDQNQVDNFNMIFNQSAQSNQNYSYIAHFEFAETSGALKLEKTAIHYLGRGKPIEFSIKDITQIGRLGLLYLLDQHICFLENTPIQSTERFIQGLQDEKKLKQIQFTQKLHKIRSKFNMEAEISSLKSSNSSDLTSSLISLQNMCQKTKFSLRLIFAIQLNEQTDILLSEDFAMDLGVYALLRQKNNLQIIQFQNNNFNVQKLYNIQIDCSIPQIFLLDGNYNGKYSILISCKDKSIIFHPIIQRKEFFINLRVTSDGAGLGSKNGRDGIGTSGPSVARFLGYNNIIITRCRQCDVNVRSSYIVDGMPLGTTSAYVSRLGAGDVRGNAEYAAGVVPNALVALEAVENLKKWRFFMFLPENELQVVVVTGVALGITFAFGLITIGLFAREQRRDKFARNQTRRRFA